MHWSYCKDSQNIFVKIMKHPCILGFLFAFGLTMLCWTISHTVQGSQNFPRRPMHIFPPSSYVKDIHNGSLETLGIILRESDIRLVVFYAPWCAQSRKLVPQVQAAAVILKEKMNFIAINCWLGSCRSNFTLQEFPKIYVYHTNYPPVEFMEPPFAWRIQRFLDYIARPFHYLGNEQHLANLISSNEPVVIGYFNMKKKINKRFSIFLELCISSANRVSKQLYGIVTNSKMAALTGLRNYGDIVMHQPLGDKTYFPDTANFTSTSIFLWIIQNRVKVVKQLTPNMTYLDHYITELKRGPAVLLFLSFRPKFVEQSTDLLRQFNFLAAQYNNCSSPDISYEILETDQIADANEMNKEQLSLKHFSEFCMTLSCKNNCTICQFGTQKKHYLQQQLKFHLKDLRTLGLDSSMTCSCLRHMSYYYADVISVCCMGTTKSRGSGTGILQEVFNTMRDNQIKQHKLLEIELQKLKALNSNDVMIEDSLNPLKDAVNNILNMNSHGDTGHSSYSKLLARKLEDSKNNLPDDSMFKTEHEAVNTVESKSPVLKLRQMHSGKKKHGNFLSRDFKGLKCKTNRTVNFYYLDYDIHEVMVKSLGVDQKAVEKGSTLALVDLKNEATYILNESSSVSSTSIVEFITNFTNGALERRLRSSKSINECSRRNRSSNCITEVTKKTFENVVLNNSKDVFLMYYAPWCGYCKHGYRVFLQLAKHYSGVNTLQFARINMDQNDLPYHYTVDGYPSFILFPRRRKSYSHAYPENQPLRFKDMKNFLRKYSSKLPRRTIKSINSNYR